MQLAVALVCLAAGLFQLLASAPHIGERTILRTARRITGVALMSAGGYVLYMLHFYGGTDAVYCWILGLVALGQLLFSMNTFMDPHRTEVLMQSASALKGRLSETSHA